MKTRIGIAALAAAAAALLWAVSASAFTPRIGHWWNPNESGRGYNVDVHDGILIFNVCAYEANGDPEWYLALGPLSADQRQFTGTLDKSPRSSSGNW